MPEGPNNPAVFQEFREALGTRDPKTIATYVTTMRDFVAWLATQPSGASFHLGLITETAIRGYMDSLQQAGRSISAILISALAALRYSTPKEERRGRWTSTTWLAGRSTSISFQSARKTVNVTKKASMSSPASGRPGYASRDGQITSPSEG